MKIGLIIIISALLCVTLLAGCTIASATQAMASKNGEVSIESAKNAAFSHAGVLDEREVFMVTSMKDNLGRDDGEIIYEIDFVYNDMEYEYDLSLSGDILHCDNDIDDFDMQTYTDIFVDELGETK